MGLLSSAIRTAVVSALGAKLARGKSPIVAALIALLVSRALSKQADAVPATGEAQEEGGLGPLIEKFRQGGLEEVIRSWIGTGPNKAISPIQLQQALGPDTVARLEHDTGMPRTDLLSQLSRLLPEVIDRLTPNGQLPKEKDLLPDPDDDIVNAGWADGGSGDGVDGRGIGRG
jgi:uncharacterized protein YidB (DUF937 family)